MNKKIRLTGKFSGITIWLLAAISLIIISMVLFSVTDNKEISGLLIAVTNSIVISIILFIKIEELELRWFDEKD